MNELYVPIYLGKLLSFKNGAPVTISVIVASFSVVTLDTLLSRIDHGQLLTYLLIGVVSIGLFYLATIFDIVTGMLASRQEHINSTGSTRGYIKSNRAFRGIWKITAVTILIVTFTLFNIIMEMAGLHTVAYMFLAFNIFFALLAVGFEVHSIGENIERHSGEKPQILHLFEKILDVVQVKFITRIGKAIQESGTTKNKEDEYE